MPAAAAERGSSVFPASMSAHTSPRSVAAASAARRRVVRPDRSWPADFGQTSARKAAGERVHLADAAGDHLRRGPDLKARSRCNAERASESPRGGPAKTGSFGTKNKRAARSRRRQSRHKSSISGSVQSCIFRERRDEEVPGEAYAVSLFIRLLRILLLAVRDVKRKLEF